MGKPSRGARSSNAEYTSNLQERLTVLGVLNIKARCCARIGGYRTEKLLDLWILYLTRTTLWTFSGRHRE